MPVYTYHAIDRTGRRRRGQMPAQSEDNLEEKLTSKGVWLVEAQLLKPRSPTERVGGSHTGWLSARVRRRDLIDFCTLMSFQTRVGVPLTQALDVACHDCENPSLRGVLRGLQRHMESGLQFYEALEHYPGIFTPHFTNVIRAGEMSGKLPDSINDLREYLEWVDRVIAEVRQATLYPAIVLTVISAFVVGLFMFVIPRFRDLLISVNVELPLLTRIVFGVSSFFQATWFFWLLMVPGAIIGILIARRYSKTVATWMDQAKLKMPIFGELNWMLAISRFTHNLAILYRSGIPILSSLHLCQGLIGSVVVEDAVRMVEEAVKSGSTISEALRRHRIFPPLLLRMVVMGETTGNLDAALNNVADFYNEIIPRRIKKVLTFLEPMLTLFMIGIVGFVALSIYLPILSLMSSIK